MSRKVLSQKLVINPVGQIHGGHVSYTYHSATGELHFAGEIRIAGYFKTRRHAFQGKVQIDPRQMLSANVKLGRTVHVKALKVYVDKVSDTTASVTLDFAGAYPGHGVGVLDLTDEVVKLAWANGEGTLRKKTIFGEEVVHLDVVSSGY